MSFIESSFIESLTPQPLVIIIAMSFLLSSCGQRDAGEQAQRDKAAQIAVAKEFIRVANLKEAAVWTVHSPERIDEQRERLAEIGKIESGNLKEGKVRTSYGIAVEIISSSELLDKTRSGKMLCEYKIYKGNGFHKVGSGKMDVTLKDGKVVTVSERLKDKAVH